MRASPQVANRFPGARLACAHNARATDRPGSCVQSAFENANAALAARMFLNASISLRIRSLRIHPAVDARDLVHPATTIGVLELEHFGLRPMKVIGDIGYLLIQPLQGIA